MFRELAEEVGLRPEHVQVIGCTKGWLRYRLPKHLVRQSGKSPCIGQKQVWFLLRMVGGEEQVRLDVSERPEFDHWQWVDYWYPLRAVVAFKRHVYWRALRELAPLLFAGYPARVASVARDAEPAFRRPDSPDSRRRGAAQSPTRARSPAPPIPVVRQPEGARADAPYRSGIVLPLRRVDTFQHPVITRMVVSVRRRGELDAAPAEPAQEPPPIATLETFRSPRPSASRPHR